MEPHLNQNRYAAEQKRYYGQTVMAAIQYLGNAATAVELTRYIAVTHGQPEELVRSEVRRALHRGVTTGFFVKRERTYFLSGQDQRFHVDSVRILRRTIHRRTVKGRLVRHTRKGTLDHNAETVNNERNQMAGPSRSSEVTESEEER